MISIYETKFTKIYTRQIKQKKCDREDKIKLLFRIEESQNVA
jgi:hypothetical protein